MHLVFKFAKELRKSFVLCLFVMVWGMGVYAQKKDTANTTFVDLSADNVFGYKTDSGDISKFIGNAVFHQGTDTLYCDSLYQNKATNVIEAFSNVKMAQQGGTQGRSDYLKYLAGKKLAYMHGHVSLTDGKNDLKTEDLTYDLGAKIGNYENGGILHNDSTNVTSRSGVYNVKTKDVRFTGNAVIVDPQYTIHSEDMEYNTDTKVTRFYAKSKVVSDSGKNTLQTSKGTYDGKKGIAHFTGHSSIWNDGEYIEGDSLDYNKITGYGLGNGHVVFIDTEHHSTLYCGHAEYFHKKRVLWATIKPVMEQVNGRDTFYMRGDTFYTAPMVKVKLPKPKKAAVKTDSLLSGKQGMTKDSAAQWTDARIVQQAKKTKADTAGLVTERVATKDTVLQADSLLPMGNVAGRDSARRVTMKKTRKADTIAVKRKPDPEYVWIVPAGPKYRKIDTGEYRQQTIAAKPVTKKRGRKKSAVTDSLVVADTAAADTTAPMYFIAWHHVLLFSDSMQGKCDSMCYTRSDSTIRMINKPIAWAHKSQITGDTILLRLDSSELKTVYVPNNAFVVSQSGPPKAQLYDQVQGRTLTAYFKHNEITNMLVYPDAECIYYSKDEHDAYMGVDQGTAVRMLVFFEDQKIVNIKFQQDVHQTVTPMEQTDIPNNRLSRFKWLIDERPMSKEELFR